MQVLPWLPALMAVVSFTAAAAAQLRREPHVVRVLDAAGQPVGDADITLYWSDGLDGRGSEDIVRGRTDAQGRVIVQLLPTAAYRAFAVRDRDGEKQVTAVAPRAPTTTELCFGADARLAVDRLQLLGLAAWRAHGPLRLEFLFDGVAGLWPPVAIGDDDSVPMPPLLPALCLARLFADGRLVHQDMLFGSLWRLPPPREVRVQVRGSDGKPIAGALLERVVQHSAGDRGLLPQLRPAARFAVGTSGDDGTATVLLGARQDPFDGVRQFPGIALVASKPGFRDTWSGFSETPYCDLAAADRQKLGGVLTCTLTPEPATNLRVLAADGQQPPALQLRLWQRTPYRDGSYQRVDDRLWLPVADDGSCPKPALAGSSQQLGLAVPGVVPPLADDDPFRRLALPRVMVLSSKVLEGDTLDLRPLTALRLSILDAGRGPARGAEVVCAPIVGNDVVPARAAMHAVADGSGRVALPVLPGSWIVLALTESQWVQRRIEVAPGLPVQELQLAPLPGMAVRVVDADGKPLAGASFHVSGANWSSGQDPEARFCLDMVNEVDAHLLERVLADADGRARLPMLPASAARIEFTATHKGLSSPQLVLQPDDDLQEITLK